MSTVRNIERRMFLRRQADRDLQTTAGQPALVSRGLEWNGIWTGYLVWAGCEAILMSLALWIGFSNVNPLRASSWAGVGHGTVIWVAIMTFIATYIGGWVVGRTPRATTSHGIAKALPYWGLVVLTVMVMVAFVASQAVTVAAGGVAAVGNAAPAAATAGITGVQGQLQTQGYTVTRAEAADIGASLTAGNTGAAATALSRDAGISLAQAHNAIGRLQTTGPAAGLSGAATRAGSAAARGAKHVGGSLAGGMFWLALITLGCAIGGGATGGGGIKRPHFRQTAPKPAAS